MHRYENYATPVNGMLMIRREDVMYYDDEFFQAMSLAIDSVAWCALSF
jgi:hypothetical protein